MNRLEVKDLTATFPTADGLVLAARDVSYELEAIHAASASRPPANHVDVAC